jgi:hypothetical protein
MAKESRDGKAKVRVFFGFAEVEGGDATIQDGLRNFAAAITRVSQQPTQAQGSRLCRQAKSRAAMERPSHPACSIR